MNSVQKTFLGAILVAPAVALLLIALICSPELMIIIGVAVLTAIGILLLTGEI